MKFNSVIIKYLSDKCGCDVTTPSGATILANDIESKTGERLTPNTIKRLVGILRYDNAPRDTTLAIIAKYLGFTSWKLFVEHVNNRLSDFSAENPFVEVAGLPEGSLISFSWEPDRTIKLIHCGSGGCRVVDVANSKLLKDDRVAITQLANGYPFMAKEVIRSGQSLGSYIAAKITGISNLKVEQS